MSEELNLYGLVNKPPIDEIFNLDLVNKPPLVMEGEEDELSHYGILGMHWGIRRYQNPDGTLTDAGKRRLAKKQAKDEKVKAKAAKKREKYILNPDSKYIRKHLERFDIEEIKSAYERMDWKKKIEDIEKDRRKIGKEKVDTLIKYGDSLNSVVGFLNSDAGKGIRQKLGLNTDTIFDFAGKEKRASDAQKKEEDYNDWYRKEVAKRKLNNKYQNSAMDEDQKAFFEDDDIQEAFAEWKKKRKNKKGGS